LIHQNWKAIAAVSENGVIGKDNTLPWHIPKELEWFRSMTNKQVLVMGRKTYESIPHKCEGNEHIVLTTKNNIKLRKSNVLYLNRIEDLDAINTPKQIWICGGGEIYNQLLFKCSELYLSIIKQNVEGDTFFSPYEPHFLLKEIIEENEHYMIKHYVNISIGGES